MEPLVEFCLFIVMVLFTESTVIITVREEKFETEERSFSLYYYTVLITQLKFESLKKIQASSKIGNHDPVILILIMHCGFYSFFFMLTGNAQLWQIK